MARLSVRSLTVASDQATKAVTVPVNLALHDFFELA
eukprot:CAMPEP_0118841118 /NCGR_PEP_ID=MMETSP1162-20130426/75128_1 /TAXON_ID=33656 /ORGANISM="Phaeocystis Sp, Strain CCMP2710" /LENGTH=35 /DNA_ID= /DNA_START= /DNA_END= /DNA_ORIENTATION=